MRKTILILSFLLINPFFTNALSTSGLKKCASSDGKKIEPAQCGTNEECIAIDSTINIGSLLAFCVKLGEPQFCKVMSDCTSLGQNACLDNKGSYIPYGGNATQAELETLISETDTVGVCGILGATADKNPFGDGICNVMSIVTGKAGRGVVAVVVIVVGIMFFLGKVSWSMVLSIALGAGAIFGAPAVVSLVTGQPFRCS
jgi:type IV secretory pathway VirB2 component (pilin)